MKMRWGGVAVALCLVATAVSSPAAAVAAPSESGAGITATTNINKLKSVWGGGWVLNIGQSEGTFALNWPAQLWYNQNNDWNNRWKVRSGEASGWWMYENLFTGKCLEATGFDDGDAVVQRNCDSSFPGQRWRLAGDTNWWNDHMPVRNQMIDNVKPWANLVLTQKSQNVGSVIIMSTWTGGTTQWWKSVRCGQVLTNGSPSTPTSC